MKLTVLDYTLIEEYWRKERIKKAFRKELANLPPDDEKA